MGSVFQSNWKPAIDDDDRRVSNEVGLAAAQGGCEADSIAEDRAIFEGHAAAGIQGIRPGPAIPSGSYRAT